MKMRSHSNSSSEGAEEAYNAKGKAQDLVRVVRRPESSSSGSREKEKSFKPMYKQQRDLGKRKASTSGSPKVGLQNQRGRQAQIKSKQGANEFKKNRQGSNEKTAAFIERMRPKPLDKQGNRQNSKPRRTSAKAAQAGTRGRQTNLHSQ